MKYFLISSLLFLPAPCPLNPPSGVTTICSLRGETPTQNLEVSVFLTSTYDDARTRSLALISEKAIGPFEERGFSCGYETINIVRISKKVVTP